MTPFQKKGGQAQRQIQAIKSQAASSKTPEQKKKDAEKEQREREKAASEKAKRETAELFKPVQVQKVPFGVDPKTVLCQFYKQGNCDKGRKCKFSHDLAVERKGEKKNLYQDTRDAEKEREEEERKKDDMVDWDEGTLRPYNIAHHHYCCYGEVEMANGLVGIQTSSAKSSSANMVIPKPQLTKSANTLSKRSRTGNMAGSGRVRMEAISACTSIVYRLGMSPLYPSPSPKPSSSPLLRSHSLTLPIVKWFR